MAINSNIKNVIDTIAETSLNYVEREFHSGKYEAVRWDAFESGGKAIIFASFNLNTELFEDSTVAWVYDSVEDADSFIETLQAAYPDYESDAACEFVIDGELANVSLWKAHI